MQEEKKPTLPTNVKQIGNISQGLKIYVEDYVYTHIQQYASFAKYQEKIGVLVGKREVFEKDEVLFVNGIIQGKFSKSYSGMEVLTDESKKYISEQKEKFFPKTEILGWVYIQPGYGDFLNNSLINYHKENFQESYNVLFLYDPIEKTNGFFCKNEVSEKLEEIKGFFIYYDRNEGMHEYMLQNRFKKEKESLEKLEQTFANQTKTDIVVEKIRKSVNKEKEPISQKTRTARRKGKILVEQKKLVNFLGTVSAILFCTCVVMGTSIIKSEERLDSIEKQMAAMDNSYTYMVNLLKEGSVQSVFAAQNEELNFSSLQKNNFTETTTKENKTETTTIETKETTVTTEKPVTKTTTTQKTEETKTTPSFSSVKKKSKNKKYKVEAGDSLLSISIKFYGDSSKAKDIMEINNLTDPDKIYYGMEIELP